MRDRSFIYQCRISLQNAGQLAKKNSSKKRKTAVASTVGSTSIDPKEQSNNGVDRPARLSRVCFNTLNESFCPHGYIF